MRTFFYPIVALIVSFIAFGGCSGNADRSRNINIPSADSMVRSMALHVYAAPDSIADLSRRLMSDASDSVTRHYLATMLGFSSLLCGDRMLYDSLTSATASYLDAHPEEAALGEFFHRNRAVVFNLMGQNDSAYSHMSLALAAARTIGAADLAVEDEAALGDFAEALGELPLATAHMRRAVSMADSSHYTGKRSFAVSLGSLYAAMGNFEEADRYFDLHRRNSGDYPVYINFFFYSALGNRYYYQQRYSEAAECFRQALQLIRSIDDVGLEAMTEVNLGECLMYAGQLDSASAFINEGVSRFRGMGLQDVTQKAYMESLVGDLSMRAGRIQQAGQILMSIDTLSLPPKYRMFHYNRLVEFLSATGDYRRALDYRDKAISLERSLHDIDTRNYAAELENRYMQDTIVLNTKVQMSRKEEEVLRLRQWIYLGIALFLAAAAVVIGIALYNAGRRRKALAGIQQALMGMRLESMRNRMTPHFIFNVLNSEVNLQENKAIMRLIGLIRHNLELAESAVVSLREELRFIDDYIDVKRSALGSDFEYRMLISPEVDLSGKIPSMMIQLFVENAVKHGLQGYPGHKILAVEVARINNAVQIKVINNGRMVSPASVKGTGTGLRIVSQTIHILNSINPVHITLAQTVKDWNAAGGDKCYEVVVVIPDGYDFSPLIRS